MDRDSCGKEEHSDSCSNRDEGTAPRSHPAVDVRSDRDQAGPEQTSADELPCRRRRQRPPAEHGDETERDRTESDAPEARGEQEIERPALDEEANARVRARSQEADEQYFAEQPGAVRLGPSVIHTFLFGS